MSNAVEEFEEFSNLVEINVYLPGHLIIIRVMNIHINDSAVNDTITMNDLLNSFNLMNSVLVPTH